MLLMVACQRASGSQTQKCILLEVLRKRLIVEEDVRILELPVEPILDLLHAAHDAGKVRIPYEHDEGSVGFAVWPDDVLVGLVVLAWHRCLVRRVWL